MGFIYYSFTYLNPTYLLQTAFGNKFLVDRCCGPHFQEHSAELGFGHKLKMKNKFRTIACQLGQLLRLNIPGNGIKICKLKKKKFAKSDTNLSRVECSLNTGFDNFFSSKLSESRTVNRGKRNKGRRRETIILIIIIIVNFYF